MFASGKLRLSLKLTNNRVIGKVAVSEKRACSSFRITDLFVHVDLECVNPSAFSASQMFSRFPIMVKEVSATPQSDYVGGRYET
jgi:hypothetical protein